MFTGWINIDYAYFLIQVFAVIKNFKQKTSIIKVCVLSL